jgi:hypothetical protein
MLGKYIVFFITQTTTLWCAVMFKTAFVADTVMTGFTEWSYCEIPSKIFLSSDNLIKS